jgi:hypothetical protein
MKRTLPVALYTLAVGLAAQGWLSERLTMPRKEIPTLGAISLLGAGFALQRTWQIK